VRQLPDTHDSLVLRTDFSDASVWESVCAAIQRPIGEFRACVSILSDAQYNGLEVDQLPGVLAEGGGRSFLSIVDRTAIEHPEHPILVVDLFEEPGRTFRVIPSEMWSVENNLSIANMDFSEFADEADPDGVFRGFA